MPQHPCLFSHWARWQSVWKHQRWHDTGSWHTNSTQLTLAIKLTKVKFSLQNGQAWLSTSSKLLWPCAPPPLLFRGFGTQNSTTTTTSIAASERTCLSGSPQHFITGTVWTLGSLFDVWTVQCEHTDQELWLLNASNVLIQFDFGSNDNISNHALYAQLYF